MTNIPPACCWCVALQVTPPPANATYSDLDLLGVANVPGAEPRMWAHLCAVYVVSAVALLVS
jgi:hypothetical protein